MFVKDCVFLPCNRPHLSSCTPSPVPRMYLVLVVPLVYVEGPSSSVLAVVLLAHHRTYLLGLRSVQEALQLLELSAER
jgi:hypothetical protein